MGHFAPCQGKHACRDDGQRCLTCGRTLDEIARTRQLVEGLSDLAIAYGYENVEEFADYVAQRIRKKVAHYGEA